MARTVFAQFSVVIILFDVICFCVMKGGKEMKGVLSPACFDVQ
jgi:hypothetical protein